MKYNDALATFYYNLDRSYFMDTHKSMAPVDTALPIGYGQTISQPSLVHYMVRELSVTPESGVLEIGTGSGYQTALLAEFAKEVITVERIEPLQLRAKDRLDALHYSNIHYILGDGTDGCSAYAPYDRIIVSAAATQVPEAYLEQLNPNGIIIIPVGNAAVQDLMKVTKDSAGHIGTELLEKVRFVPLVGKYEI